MFIFYLSPSRLYSKGGEVFCELARPPLAALTEGRVSHFLSDGLGLTGGRKSVPQVKCGGVRTLPPSVASTLLVFCLLLSLTLPVARDLFVF